MLQHFYELVATFVFKNTKGGHDFVIKNLCHPNKVYSTNFNIVTKMEMVL